MYETITTNIMVKKVKETMAFYEETLGFETVLTVPENGDDLDFAIMHKDHISIMFQKQQSLLMEYPMLQTKEIVPTFTLFITVKDIEQLYEELKNKAVIVKTMHKTFYGKNEFAIIDHDGNILTISE